MKVKSFLSYFITIAMILSFIVPVGQRVISESLDNNAVISNCDSLDGWGGIGVSLDTENKTEGSASVSATDKNAIQIFSVLSSPSHISGADYIVFDLYVSDLNIFGGDASIELGSAGTFDKSEINWGPNFWKSQVTKVGWNTVRLSLEGANHNTGGMKEFDYTSVNWIRMYAIHERNTDITAKIDNIHTEKIAPEIHWDFSEVQGNVVKDKSGNGHDAEIYGTTLPTITNDGPKGQKAINFDGNSQYLVDDKSKFDFSGDFSISMWYKIPEAITAEQVIFGKNRFGSPGNREFGLAYDPGQKRLNLMYQINGSWSRIYFGTPLLNEWSHIGLTMSNHTVRIYVDGVQYATHTFTANRPDNGSPIFLGATNNSITSTPNLSQKFKGQIADVKIYAGSINMRENRTGVMIGTGDTINANEEGKPTPVWSGTYDTSKFTEGLSSVKKTGGVNNVDMTMSLNGKTVDISDMDIIEFDILTSDIDMFGTGGSSVELTSSGKPDVNEINWSETRFKPIITSSQANTWTRVQLMVSQSGKTGGDANLGAINYFRLYSVHHLNKQITINIDNLRAIKTVKTVDWDFENIDGSTVTDSSQSFNNGTITGNATTIESSTGKALVFNDGVSYVTAKQLAYDFSTAYAATVDFKVDKLNQTQTLLSAGTKWSLYVDSDNKIKYKVSLDDDSKAVLDSQIEVTQGQWHKVGISVSTNSATIYVDGVRRFTTSLLFGKKATTTERFTVGASIGGSQEVLFPLYGAVDNVVLYNGIKEFPEGRATIWNPEIAVPEKNELSPLKDVRFSSVAINDIWSYQHESSFIKFKGKMYASFTRNPGYENSSGQFITSFVSEDDGVTWKFLSDIIETQPDVSWTGTSFIIKDDKLWHFSAVFEPKKNSDYFPFMRQHAFVLDEETGKWIDKGVNAEKFYANDPPVKMSNGNWIFSGVDERWWGAVAITNGDDFMDLKVIKLPINGNLYTETTLWVDDNVITALLRVEKPTSTTNDFAVCYSYDYGETWTDAIRSNMPATYSEPSAGMLSTAQRYVIQNSFNGVYGTRDNLTLAVSEPGETSLSKIYLIRSQAVPEVLQPIYNTTSQLSLAYPYSYQIGDYLYVIYSSFAKNGSNENHIEMAKIPIAQLSEPVVPRKSVLCIGDSITEGFNWGASSQSATYPSQLQNLLGSDYMVYNYGIHGATTLKTGDKPYINQKVYQDSLKKTPDIVIIMLGTNDTKDINWEKKENYISDLTALVNTYKAKLNPNGQIYLATSASIYEGAPRPARVDELVEMQNQVAEATGSILVDINTLTAGKRDEYYNDNTHLNDKGYALIANEFANTITGKILADDVIILINQLPAVEDLILADKADVVAARAAFNNLTLPQQLLVDSASLNKLISLEAKIKQLEQDATDLEKAESAQDKINALPEVSAVKVSDKSAVQSARAAYAALTDAQKALVNSDAVDKLSALETKITELENQAVLDKQKSDEVTGKINLLPEISTVKVSDKSAVQSARAAYTALTDAQKALVNSADLNKLKALEDKIVELENEKPEPSESTTSSSGESTTTQTGSGGAQTGDNSRTFLFISLLVSSIVALFVFVRRRKHC